MKAAVLQEANKPLTIEDVDIIDPRAGEVLVRTSCSGVCHSDLHFVDGSWQLPMSCVLGHEAAGVVEAIGEGVTYVKPGDRVIMSFRPFCGKCYYCLGGRPNLCNDPEIGAASASRLTWNGSPILQFASVGSFAEMMVTSENGLVKIPDEMPMAEASLIGCGVMTGVGAALYTANVPGGSTVAVIGCGGIGLNIIQGCRIAGAANIIAIDIMDSKLEMASQFGATHTINSKEVDLDEAIKEITKGEGVEYAWFNNVETKPGTGYPTKWEDQLIYKGGWEEKAGSSNTIQLKGAGKAKGMGNIFHNPNLPVIDDYYEPFTYKYLDLIESPEADDQPTARPVSLITGKPMDIKMGPNWDDDLSGSPDYARNDPNLENLSAAERESMFQLEKMAFFYLP
ncbi:MAG: alcohol dehydrogenase catalytic domain-containing protein, partial [Gammaproteobacteria bacterium]|nr:alcohol dehydrogenase catalytic domain-containing protein [Gammaproteobacteria bacterium]